MDGIIFVVCAVVVAAVLGFVLGLAGLLQARRALAEVAALRASLRSLMQAGATAPPVTEPLPVAVREPPPLPTRRMEPPPLPQPLLQPSLAEAAAVPPERARVDIELLLTQRWGVWVGAVALLFAGVFLVRYAVAHAWLGPAVRCALAGLLGVALVGGAEWLRRRPAAGVPMPNYAPAALAAGGVGVLFAAAYGAGPLYGLVPAVVGFVLLAAAGLAGLALSLVFGPMVGAVGLAAAFVTPALEGSAAPFLPGLFAYLLFVTAASWAVVRLTAWTWLGWAAAVGGAGWVVLSGMLAGVFPGDPTPGAWAPGLFVPAAAGLTLALLPGAALEHGMGRRFAWAPLLLLGLAGVWLVAVTGDGWVRAGLLLLGPVAMAKGWTEPRLAWLPMVSAGIAVLTVLAWTLPVWRATGEVISVEGVTQAVLPGGWAPAVVRPLLATVAGVALLYAAVGLAGERRQGAPLPWAGLVAGVPVVLLAVTFAQVGRFQGRPAWALLAGVLGIGLVLAAGLARREGSLPRAGLHAAGAVAALALGCAIVLSDAWLTVALALMLPGLAWVEGQVGLAALRRVALVVAGAVLVRLLLNPFVTQYAVGSTPVLNGLLVAYGLPAACFGAAAWLFRRGADDRLVAVLEAGACAFGTLLVVLEVHHGARGGDWAVAQVGFAELGWMVTALGLGGVALQAWRARPVLGVAWRVLLGLALAGGVGLLAWYAFLDGDEIGRGLIGNALLPAYLLPAVLAGVAVRRGGVPRLVAGGYGLTALFAWWSGEVWQAFHRGEIAPSGTDSAELWAYSGAWLALAALLMVGGAVGRERALRLVGLALTAVVVVKVFLVDMAGLDGLWRVLSFLGLGLGLIGLGAVYRRFGGGRPAGEAGP